MELLYRVFHLDEAVHLSTDELRIYLESQHGTRYLRLIGLSVAVYKGRRISARAGCLVSAPCYIANAKQSLWLLNLTHCDTWR